MLPKSVMVLIGLTALCSAVLDVLFLVRLHPSGSMRRLIWLGLACGLIGVAGSSLALLT